MDGATDEDGFSSADSALPDFSARKLLTNPDLAGDDFAVNSTKTLLDPIIDVNEAKCIKGSRQLFSKKDYDYKSYDKDSKRILRKSTVI